jgi:hypothetical protein
LDTTNSIKDKNVIIDALFFYMANADFEEQVHCLNQFDQYKDISLETDPHERATKFENVISNCIKSLINDDDIKIGV